VLPETASATVASRRRIISVRIGLAGVILLGFVTYASLAHFVVTPRIFYDELIYMEAAASLADGGGLSVRDEPYEYGPLYPTLLAPLHWMTSDREGAYELSKLLNALLLALTAIPAYLLARRLLRPWPSVGVAALTILVPSSVYVTVVMTESLAYLTFTWALYVIVLAAENPTFTRQVAALVTIAIAILARPQFLALYAAYLLTLGLAALVLPQRRAAVWGSLARLWPTGASFALGVVLFIVLPLVRGSRPENSLGDYEALWRSYDVATVAKWLVYHLAEFELYLAVVPFAVAPIVLAAFLALARGGSGRHGAFFATFLAVNTTTLVVTAVIVTFQDSPGLEIDRLHDRYLFYVVPLWMIVLGSWIVEGRPPPRLAAVLGIGLALILAIVFPYGELELENGVKLFSAVGTAFPAAVSELSGSAVAGGVATFALVSILIAVVFFRPERAGPIALSVLVGVFLVNGILVWGRAFNPPEGRVFAGPGLERRWVDELVPEGATVTLFQSVCEEATLERDSYLLTEFFNSSIVDVVQIGGEFPTGRIDGVGQALLNSGKALQADHVVAQPGVPIRGRRLGSGTSAGLVLWEINGPVRIDGAASSGDLVRRACGGSGA
jgi:hypothetical protein